MASPNNEIIAEVRAARESLAAKFDFDVRRIVADAMQRQEAQHTVNRQTCSKSSSMASGERAGVTKPPAE